MDRDDMSQEFVHNTRTTTELILRSRADQPSANKQMHITPNHRLPGNGAWKKWQNYSP